MRQLRIMIAALLAAVTSQVMGQTAEQDSMRAVFDRLFYKNCYSTDKSAQVASLKQHFPNVEEIKLEMAIHETLADNLHDMVFAAVQEKMTLDELRAVEKEWSDGLYYRLNLPLPTLQMQELTAAPTLALMTGKATADELKSKWDAQHAITDARYKDVIDRYVAANTSTMKTITSTMQQLTLDDAKAKELIDFIMQMAFDCMKEMTARYYKPEEIERMTVFFPSETGKKYMECFLDKLQEVTAQVMKQGDLAMQYKKAIASYTPQQVAEFAAKRAQNESPWCEPIVNNSEIAWADGTYAGEVFNGKPHGVGTYTNKKGEKFMGFYRYGQRNGLILYTKRGKIYVECWADDVKENDNTFSVLLPYISGRTTNVTGKPMPEVIIKTADGKMFGWGDNSQFSGINRFGTRILVRNSAFGDVMSATFYGNMFKGTMLTKDRMAIKGTMYGTNLVGPYTCVVQQDGVTITQFKKDNGLVGLVTKGTDNDYTTGGYGRIDDEGNFTGSGVLQSNGVYLDGLFYNGELYKGTVKHGDYHYVGEMKENLVRHGEGTILDEKGEPKYQGTWANDQLHGDDCTVFLEDGMVKGKCVLGKMVSGTVTLNDGKTFPLKETIDFRFE